ncbi:MAG TPA: hypothetical protein VGX96_10665 [Candidatus Elarobacter sp.]|nr:hypothetical protein [Candidatus Elarobacter sp.]
MPPRWSPAGLILLVLVAIVAVLASFSGGTRNVQAQIGANPCSKVSVKATMPPTFDLQGSLDFQISADCVAWQQFIYLNWRAKGQGIPDPAAPASALGTPVPKLGAYTTVWESYANPDVVFGTATARKNLTAAVNHANGLRTLSAISKADGDDVHLSGFQQAFTLGWLTSRYRDVTFYEERIDNDELGYITSNHLTSIQKQKDCVRIAGLSLPAGTGDVDCTGKPANYGNLGAIEVKAAWIQLHDPAKYSRYLISRANLVYPDGRIVNDAVVGLVGLHIIRKVPKAAQFAWATFEHVDNDPDATPYPVSPRTAPPDPSPTPTPLWTYYRSGCTGPYCRINALATPCANGRAAPPPGCQPYNVPTQTQRHVPVGVFATQSTSTFRDALAKAHADGSVFRYYRMIDTQWPRAVTPTRQQRNATIPLSEGSPDPQWPVSNTTLETYVQTASCMTCHRQAPIASSSTNSRGRAQIRLLSAGALRAMKAAPGGSATYASDWSFVFSKAHQP